MNQKVQNTLDQRAKKKLIRVNTEHDPKEIVDLGLIGPMSSKSLKEAGESEPRDD